MTSVSGLSAAHRAQVRRLILQGCNLMLTHRESVHYTQGPARWEGITHRLHIAHGQYPHNGDCSSTQTWLHWSAFEHVHPGIANHGKRVHDVRNAKVGDSVLYGSGFPYEHVATYIGGGMVFSHGSEGGPYKLPIDYRPDRAQIRRHI